MSEPQRAKSKDRALARRGGRASARIGVCACVLASVLFDVEDAGAQSQSGESSATPVATSSSAPSFVSRLRWGAEGGITIFGEDWRLDQAWTSAVFVHARSHRLAVGLLSGIDFWRSRVVLGSGEEVVGVWFIGPQGELSFLDDRARSAFSAGLTVVVNPTVIDESAGGLGFYVDARPLGLRFPWGKHWSIGLDPLGLRFLIADTSAIPLVETHFLTLLRVEAKP